MEKEFVLDIKKIEFPVRVVFNSGEFVLDKDGDEYGDFKVLKYKTSGGQTSIESTLLYTTEELRALHYLLTGYGKED